MKASAQENKVVKTTVAIKAAGDSPRAKRGRPARPLTWPTGEFSAKEIAARFKKQKDGAMTQVGVHLKLKRALASGEIVKVGTRRKGKNVRGRSQFTYMVAANAATTAVK